MRDRDKRRNQKKQNTPAGPSQQPAPLQPSFLEREQYMEGNAEGREDAPPQPVYEAQPEKDPFEAAPAARARRTRRRGRGGRGRNRTDQQQRAAQSSELAGLPIVPGRATGEAAEIDTPEGLAEAPELDLPEPPEITGDGEGEDAGAGEAAAAPVRAPRSKKGAVVLAIGLPGSGKSSWFKRHDIIPLSSDLVRGLLFDDATEQRFQDLVFSSLRSLLRARLIAERPMNFIDATNLSPKERHSWIKMAHDFGYEAHAVFFDVPTEVCMDRNRRRERNVPDEVMLRMAQKLRPPKFDEGFAKVVVVRLKHKAAASAAAAAAAAPKAPEPEEDDAE
ncbi:MAG: ATP-binding protein [Acidobacteriota bacterium]|nr:ATP-binding protein [Acidobacteriota bacterium]